MSSYGSHRMMLGGAGKNEYNSVGITHINPLINPMSGASTPNHTSYQNHRKNENF